MTSLSTGKKFTCTDLDPGKNGIRFGRDLEPKKERETFSSSDRDVELKSRLYFEILGQIIKF
jgi:hypothetical protein